MVKCPHCGGAINPAAERKRRASRMNADTSNEAGIVLEAALEVLETKMSEADFIRFCDKLAA